MMREPAIVEQPRGGSTVLIAYLGSAASMNSMEKTMNSKTGVAMSLAIALCAGALLHCQPAAEDPSTLAAEPTDDETITAFTNVWAKRLGYYTGSYFLGIQTLQNPTDAWVTQEIIAEVKPDFIVECGTRYGGSALYWAMLLKEINPTGRVITIDIEDRVTDAKDRTLWKERVDFLVGSSTSPKIVEEVRRRVKGGRVLVILDSLHTYDHVYNELKSYAPLVDVGSYVVVQDTGLGNIRVYEQSAGGVRQFLEEHPDFKIDKKRERFMITNNPDGYLRRIR